MHSESENPEETGKLAVHDNYPPKLTSHQDLQPLMQLMVTDINISHGNKDLITTFGDLMSDFASKLKMCPTRMFPVGGA